VIFFRRKRRHLPPPNQRPREAEKARERAEDALAEVRARRERQRALRDWFRAQYDVNGYGRDVDAIWGGKS
jgi:transglutaminase-like putative cysteine protease